MSYPLNPVVKPKHVKRHRKMYFEPLYVQYNFKSQLEFDKHYWTKDQVEYYASFTNHSYFDRAVAVLKSYQLTT